jgi:hypothetical protein
VIGRRKSAEKVYALAEAAVGDFWGLGSNGGKQAFRRLEDALKALKLDAAQLDRLRMELPPITPGTTGDKIRRADSLLKRLHAAKV